MCHSIADMPYTNHTSLDDDVETVVEEAHYMENIPILHLDSTASDNEDTEYVESMMDVMHNQQQNTIEVPSAGGCSVMHKFLREKHFSWVPACDCHGYFKKVQCDTMGDDQTCWCSTRGGSEEAFTRMTLNCNNVS